MLLGIELLPKSLADLASIAGTIPLVHSAAAAVLGYHGVKHAVHHVRARRVHIDRTLTSLGDGAGDE